MTVERLGRLPDGEKRDILLTPFHAANVGAIDAHTLGHRFLAQASGKPDAPQIQAKNLANIHQERWTSDEHYIATYYNTR